MWQQPEAVETSSPLSLSCLTCAGSLFFIAQVVYRYVVFLFIASSCPIIALNFTTHIYTDTLTYFMHLPSISIITIIINVIHVFNEILIYAIYRVYYLHLWCISFIIYKIINWLPIMLSYGFFLSFICTFGSSSLMFNEWVGCVLMFFFFTNDEGVY